MLQHINKQSCTDQCNFPLTNEGRHPPRSPDVKDAPRHAPVQPRGVAHHEEPLAQVGQAGHQPVGVHVEVQDVGEVRGHLRQQAVEAPVGRRVRRHHAQEGAVGGNAVPRQGQLGGGGGGRGYKV